MTIDKSALLARAKADPVAFMEETADLLHAMWMCGSAIQVRQGRIDMLAPIANVIRSDMSDADLRSPEDARVLAHVEALGEALGVKV